ncbi:MAG: PPOX class F420-dependent oxidoreductase [Chloroflexota bacterium]
MDTEHQGEFSELVGYSYIHLTTFRKDSSAVQTTVLFAVIGDHVYVQTPKSAGKTRRITATGRVLVQPTMEDGTPPGKSILGLGRVVEGREAEAAVQALHSKYGEYFASVMAKLATTDEEWETIQIRAWDE